MPKRFDMLIKWVVANTAAARIRSCGIIPIERPCLAYLCHKKPSLNLKGAGRPSGFLPPSPRPLHETWKVFFETFEVFSFVAAQIRSCGIIPIEMPCLVYLRHKKPSPNLEGAGRPSRFLHPRPSYETWKVFWKPSRSFLWWNKF